RRTPPRIRRPWKVLRAGSRHAKTTPRAACSIGVSDSWCSGRTPADPGLAEHLGRHAEFTPCAVGDALALRVTLRRLHEVFLERTEIRPADRHPCELHLEAPALLDQFETARPTCR